MKPETVVPGIKKNFALAMRKSQRDVLGELNKLNGRIKRRVFLEGKNSSGSGIGTYSTKPYYASLNATRKRYGGRVKASGLKARGKNSAAQKFKNGKPRKSRYLQDGYKEFRQQVGRGKNGGKINLDLTGQLRDSIITGTANKRLVIGVKDARNTKLRKVLELKYGQVFQPTNTEKNAFEDNVTKAIQKNIETVLRNL